MSKGLLFVCCFTLTVTTVPSAVAGGQTYECFREVATIVGTPGDDVLIGSEETADVIMGLGGDDVIRGSEDINSATAPGDRLCGGSGDDYIRGAVGEDRIQGGGNNDDVDGSFGYDVITQGGPGIDRVSDCDSEYTGGVRILQGGSGGDHLCTDTDRVRMYGEGGNDVLIDLSCSEKAELRGGYGDDRFESYFDNQGGENCSDSFDVGDALVGGPGTDEAIISPNDTALSMETTEVS